MLTTNELKAAVSSHAAAFRCVTEYQPAGGAGDKVFPPTYEGGKYATEKRVLKDGRVVDCVLLDSVQSQANRMELALLEARETNRLAPCSLPMVRVTFEFAVREVRKTIRVTSLEAPHRVADALFRDSCYQENGKPVLFRKSRKGGILDHADLRNATGLFGLCPTALLFGLWDSTGPRGGLGAKFQRALVSEIVGIDAQPGIATGGKVDHLNILTAAGPLLQRREESESHPHWTLDKSLAEEKEGKELRIGKEGRPSEANLGGVTPDLAYAKDSRRNNIRESDGTWRIKGGFTIGKAVQTTVLSLTALRRLHFPVQAKNDAEVATANRAARTALAALGLCAATLAREEGSDLRSRCQLVPIESFVWELLDGPEKGVQFELSADSAVGLFKDAVAEAVSAGLPWETEVIDLTPSSELLELVRRSHEIAAEGQEGVE
jgi:CRISPR-associated protein Csb1